jgi:hypothetical protein
MADAEFQYYNRIVEKSPRVPRAIDIGFQEDDIVQEMPLEYELYKEPESVRLSPHATFKIY